ncbi:hypothetical protein Pcinc_014509 [Petrolisthes cinctipes]|uniref:Uncharacterized protein n=1 Tax=Petrolisthes cinctipes TaxID=88211 RepID=A0AAE1FUX7_PETCI|nr:hypothetical protein Pcinc_014509 [Petrolisthes cinctipes]
MIQFPGVQDRKNKKAGQVCPHRLDLLFRPWNLLLQMAQMSSRHTDPSSPTSTSVGVGCEGGRRWGGTRPERGEVGPSSL